MSNYLKIVTHLLQEYDESNISCMRVKSCKVIFQRVKLLYQTMSSVLIAQGATNI